MKLSACYIVGKDELDFEKSLQSLENQVDEIIVITTAEDRNVLDIAARYHADIYLYIWHDDFAAARNFAIEKASGDWIVFLDADEYIAGTSLQCWRKLIEQKIKALPKLEEIFIKRIDIDTEKDNEITAEVFVPRFFVCRSDVRYQGHIHEDLRRKDGLPLVSDFLDTREISLIHTGYSGSLGLKKAERNLKILLEDIKTVSDPLEHYMAIAEAYEGMGKFAKAIEYAKKDILLKGRRSISYASRSYRVLFRLWESTTRIMDDEILHIAANGVKDFPELPEFWAQYAVYLANVFRYSEAIEAMRKALVCFKEYCSMEPSTFNEENVRQGELWIVNWQEYERLEKSLRISACVITKDEEGEISQWIDNLKKCTDEQILVDTGSTDHTLDIAKVSGVKTYHFAWQDDFAAAKNFALEQASGDWIVFLDADEYFDEASCQDIRHVIAREHHRVDSVDAILCPWINIDVDQKSRQINRGIILRVFRNASYLRYAGKVHENIRNTHGELNILVEKKNLAIYHTGYSSQRLQGKLKRNLKLLLEDIEINGEGVQHYRYLLDCYIGLGEYDMAIKYAKLHIASTATSIGNESDVYRNLIIALSAVHAPLEEILFYSEAAIQRFPATPDFYIYKGTVLLQQKNLLAAKESLMEADRICQQVQDVDIMSTSYAQLLLGLYCHLADVFFQLGEEDKTKYYLALGLQENRYSEELFSQTYRFLANKPVAQTIEFLDCYYTQTKEDYSFIVEHWGRFSQDEVYSHYMKQLEENEIKDKKVLSFQQNVKLATNNIQFLLYCLFEEEDLLSLPEIKQVLADVFIPWLERYHDDDIAIRQGDYDAYISLLQMMRIFNAKDTDLLNRFCGLITEFSLEQQRVIAGICSAEGFWQEAGKLYTRILAADKEYDAGLYKDAGICFFHCQNRFAAKKYLQKALTLVTEEKQINEVKSYLSWLN